DDADTWVIIAVAVTVATLAVAPVVAGEHVEGADIDEAAFFEIEFALFVSAVSGPDAQVLVSANGRIAARGLIVHGDAAVDATATDEIFHDICHIIVLSSAAVLGAHDLPAIVLSAGWRAEKSDPRGHEKRRNNKNRVACG